MAKKIQKPLTTTEFSKLAGVPAAMIGKLLREGKLKGTKSSGRWMISADQLKSKALLDLNAPQKPVKAAVAKTAAKAGQAPRPKPEPKAARDAGQAAPADKKRAAAQTFSISEFSRLTFLTEYGVETFLKTGRLKGSKDSQGQWRVDADNLDSPGIRHLIR